VKSSQELEEEIRGLLEYSKWDGRGPHGQTINAVMKRVRRMRLRAQKQELKLKLVKKAS
jgi:hypothetical protein